MKMFCATVRSGIRLNSWWMMLMPSSSACRGDVGSYGSPLSRKEADLATRLGLSRNSLREAVRALTLARILEARQGDGTYVTSLEPSMLLEPLTFMAEFHQDRTLLQVLEVRRILEAATAALYDALANHRPDVARAIATADIAGVEAWLEGALEAPGNGDARE
jgi:DNA-binding FadR family transcriptional regulator